MFSGFGVNCSAKVRTVQATCGLTKIWFGKGFYHNVVTIKRRTEIIAFEEERTVAWGLEPERCRFCKQPTLRRAPQFVHLVQAKIRESCRWLAALIRRNPSC